MKWMAFLIILGMALADECEPIKGLASWYGKEFHGRRTASGELFNKYKYTAASKVFPIGSYVLVRNMNNGKEVVVRINDRGPWIRGRILDLSKSAAHKLGIVAHGVAPVEVIPLKCISHNTDTDDLIGDLLNTY